MFIKKDLRKIPTILDDAIDCDHNNHGRLDSNGANDHGAAPKRTKLQEPLRELRLGRRQQEFHGSLQILCQPRYLPKLRHLQTLNLYDCNIDTLDGIGLFEGTPQLEKLNLGRNPLGTVPDELVKVQSLKHVWLDDCQLTGSLPRSLLQLQNLETLRLPNNHITDIPFLQQDDDDDDAGDDDDDDDDKCLAPLKRLQVLCLDRNELQSLPPNLRSWTPNLTQLLVRHNRLEGPLRGRLPSTLQVLHVSSNHLTSLDALVDDAFGEGDGCTESSPSSFRPPQCPHLTHLYANGNQLTNLPDGIVSRHPKLQRLVVSHNPTLSHVPDEFWEACTNAGGDVAMMAEDDPTLEILWEPNPNLSPPL
jgi:Leucine-rich repeat (LRR) protein